MKSRARVLNALSHRAVDRIPIDFWGHNDTTIHRVAYERLRTYLGFPPIEPTIANDVENVVYAAEDILLTFGVDTRAVYLPIPDRQGEPQPDGSLLLTWPDGSVWRKPPGGLYYDLFRPALPGELTSQAIAAMPWPKFPPDALEGIGKRAEQLRRTTDYAVVMAGFLIMPVTGTQIWRGFDQWCVDTLENTKLWQEMTEAYLERAFSQAEAILKAVGQFIDVAYFIGDDIATQNGPFISPSFYRKYIKPYHRQIVEFVRSRTDAKIVFHMCGAAREFIPDLIDVGVDAINPVQTTAQGMEPWSLKREFGPAMAFWGGVDTQRILPFGTPEDVKNEVRRIIDALGPSGLVLASSHNLQPDVPPENIIALFEAAQAYRF